MPRVLRSSLLRLHITAHAPRTLTSAPYGLPFLCLQKWHLGMSSWEYTPTYRGFESHFGFYNGAVHYWAHTHPESNASSPLDFRSGVEERSPATVVGDRNGTVTRNMSDYGPFVYARETARLIDDHSARRDERPLFLFLTHQSTHEPIDAPASYVARFTNTIANKQRRTFAGMVLALDDAVRTVVDAMKRNEFWENTLLVFHSDNGGNLGASGNNFPLRGGKYRLFEGGTRVTAFVSGPALPQAVRGTASARLMHEVDWLPTFLSLADAQAKVPGDIDGVDQWAAISSPSAPAARQGFIYNIDPCAYNSKNYSNFSAIRVGDFKYIDAISSPANEWQPLPAASGASGAASAVGSGDTGPWLFNVMADPTERTNLVTSTPDKAAELKAALDAAAQQTRYPFNCKGEPGATKVPINITCPGNVWTPWA